MANEPQRPQRGEIWRIDLNPTKGSETNKTRPCLIISSDDYFALPIRTVVPLTGWQEKFERFDTYIRIDLNDDNGLAKPSVADTHQMRSVSLERFIEYVGFVSDEILEAVVLAVGLVIEHP